MIAASSVVRQHTLITPYAIGEVHFYSTEINGELVLFDSGPPTVEAFTELSKQIDLSKLKYVFITHCHIDHYGLVARIAENSNARILIPRLDAIKLQRHSEYLDLFVKLLSDFGCDSTTTSQIRKVAEKDCQTINIGNCYEIVEDSDIPAKLDIKWLSCPSHTQSDLVYLYGEHAISGDTLLKNIFHVPIFDVNLQDFNGRFRNYDAYCESIKLIWSLQNYHILPGHRKNVESAKASILFYVKKLFERARQVKKHSSSDSYSHLIGKIFGNISHNPFFVHMKLSEIVFAKDFLEQPQKLKNSLQSLALFDEIADSYYKIVEF